MTGNLIYKHLNSARDSVYSKTLGDSLEGEITLEPAVPIRAEKVPVKLEGRSSNKDDPMRQTIQDKDDPVEALTLA